MVGKIPPHVARELRRHLVKQSPPLSNPSTGTSSSAGNSDTASSVFSSVPPKALAGCLALTATMTLVPFAFMNWIRPLSDREDALTKSQIRRGAFNNSGSRDAGIDPYWDFKNGRRKRVGEDGCEDDGGYADLFLRDNPEELDPR